MTSQPDIPAASWWFRYLVYPVLYFISCLPWGVLYTISDFLNFLLYRLFKYRLLVVRENLQKSFPEKNKEELNQIERQYYSHLSDLFVETIKGLSMRKNELLERMKFPIDSNPFNDFYNKQQPVIVVLTHSGNWEWIALSSQLYCPQKVFFTYKPLSDSGFNWLMHKIRSRFGAVPMNMRETPRFVSKQIREGEPFVVALIGDQSPSNVSGVYWRKFLNQETAFLSGPAKLSEKYQMPIVYLSQSKLKRGYYSADFHTINLQKDATAEDVMDELNNAMINEIKQQPFTWLWSHRRWKHSLKSE